MRQRLIKLCFVYSVPVSEDRADFLTHIPIRMKRMVSDKIEISVLYNGTLNEEILMKHDIRVRKSRLSRITQRFKYLQILFMAGEVFREAKKEDIDLFINANNHYFLFAAAVGAKLAGKSVLARVTGIRPERDNPTLAQRIRRKTSKILARISISLADKAICLADYLKEKLIDDGVDPDKLIILSQGVDLSRFKIRKRNPDEEMETILYVGRLELTKGIEKALEAFLLLKKRYQDLNFILCGEGSLKQKLVLKYGKVEGLSFLGHVAHDEISSIYQKSDVLILPSFSEGLSNVILEAMASGVAVIASNVGGNAQLLDFGQRGILIEPGSTGHIVSAVAQYIEDTAFFRECIQNGRDYVEKEHSFEVLSEYYLDLLKSICKTQGM